MSKIGCSIVLYACLLGGRVWACPLMGILCACPLHLLILSSGVLNRTLSHIWCRLYLPTFLLSVPVGHSQRTPPSEQSTYRTIDKDSSNRLKTKFITLLRQLKWETELEDHIYKNMYPTGCSSLKLYGLSKIHIANNPP